MFDFFCNSYRKRTTITIFMKSKELRRNNEIHFVFFHLAILTIRSFGGEMFERHEYCLVNKQVKLLLYTCCLEK